MKRSQSILLVLALGIMLVSSCKSHRFGNFNRQKFLKGNLAQPKEEVDHADESSYKDYNLDSESEFRATDDVNSIEEVDVLPAEGEIEKGKSEVESVDKTDHEIGSTQIESRKKSTKSRALVNEARNFSKPVYRNSDVSFGEGLVATLVVLGVLALIFLACWGLSYLIGSGPALIIMAILATIFLSIVFINIFNGYSGSSNKSKRGNGWSGIEVFGIFFISALVIGFILLIGLGFSFIVGPTAAWIIVGILAFAQLFYAFWMIFGKRPRWDGNEIHSLAPMLIIDAFWLLVAGLGLFVTWLVDLIVN